MTEALKSRVLVLSKSWIPIDTTTAVDAITSVFRNRAKIIGSDYNVYDFDEWVENWSDAKKLAEVAETMTVGSVNFRIAVPEVIVLTEYNGFVIKKAKLSRDAIFVRDDYTCQYCGKKKKRADMNIDHVIPKGQGGKTNWKNLVLSCFPCNGSKGCRTPREAGMELIRKPYEPHWSMIKKNKGLESIPKSWEEFIGKLYWNTGLEE